MAARKTAAKKASPQVVQYVAMNSDFCCSEFYDDIELALDFAASEEWFNYGSVTILQKVAVYRQNNSYEEVTE